MPRSAAQSDFVVTREPTDDEAPVVSNEASTSATRIVLWATLIMLAALVLLTVIGPHIPSGE